MPYNWHKQLEWIGYLSCILLVYFVNRVHACTCDPTVGKNLCDSTTSCIYNPNDGKHYCACAAGYKADGAANTDTTKHWRMSWPGQEYRVFVKPGLRCWTSKT
jgi:hypothetical protein